MVALSNNAIIGVIAEEYNDVEVLYEVTCKIIPKEAFSFRHFIGHGCGKIRRKCIAWATNLLQRGCTHLVVMHDLDRNDKTSLRRDLEMAIAKVGFDASLVLIPSEELEAWLLSDPQAIKATFKMRILPKIPKDTEGIASPKEFLAEIVTRNSKTTYLNTVHNKRIAKNLGLSSIARCPSFLPYPEFLRKV